MSAEPTAHSHPHSHPHPHETLPQTHPIEEFLERHLKSVLIGVGVLALVAIGFGVSRYRAHQGEVEAAEAFGSAATVEDCDKVIAHHPGSTAAGSALLLKAELLWSAGKKDSSLEALKTFLASYTSHPLLAQAKLGLASKEESMGDKSAAQKLYEDIVKTNPNTEAAPAAQLRLGDLAWAEGKLDEAKKIFDKLPSSYPGKMDPFMDQIRQRREIMAAGLPNKEVDGPPPAPKPVAPPAPAPQLLVPGLNTPMPAPKPDLTPPTAPKLPEPAKPTSPAPAPPKPAAQTPAPVATPPAAPKPAEAAVPPPTTAPVPPKPPGS